MYRKGLGVPQDNMQALVWYRKAADQGNDIAQLRLQCADVEPAEVRAGRLV